LSRTRDPLHKVMTLPEDNIRETGKDPGGAHKKIWKNTAGQTKVNLSAGGPQKEKRHKRVHKKWEVRREPVDKPQTEKNRIGLRKEQMKWEETKKIPVHQSLSVKK